MKLLSGIPALAGIIALCFFISAGAVFSASSIAGSVKLDSRSKECIKCHKADVTDKHVSIIGDTGGHEHPVGVDYFSLALRNPTLMKPSELVPALTLVNGRISCITCHVPYDESNHLKLAAKRKRMPAIPDPMLTVDNTMSGLCTSCHLK